MIGKKQKDGKNKIEKDSKSATDVVAGEEMRVSGSDASGSKEHKDSKPKGTLKKKLLKGCGFLAVISVLVIVSSLLIGVFVVPYGKDWLVEHNFMEGTTDDGTSSSTGTTREVVVETNWVTDVVEKSKKSVVSIAISEVGLDPQLGTVESSVNIGTGFVIDDSGLILTNQHVVSNPQDEYVVVDWDGKEHSVIEIVRDNVNDLAILKVEANGLEALPLGNSEGLAEGQFVVAIGTPLGDLPGTVTTGVVSGLGRSVTASSGGFWGTSRTYEDVIQTDAAVNPGNSGGPLLDVEGSVVGINFATTSGADNISFAIPINRAKEKIEEYNAYGKFIRPYLGVEYQIISQAEAMFYRNVVPGALVTRVVSGSPADKAGIKKGDIITKIDDEMVGSSLSVAIQGYEVGDEITVELWDDGDFRQVTAELEEAD